jgi:hypothetical protein
MNKTNTQSDTFELLDYNNMPISTAGYNLTLKGLFLFFITHLNWIRFIPHWHKTLNKYQNITAIDLCLPWYNYGAINWVKNYIKKEMKVFEYGTGGSTLFYANSAYELISVEHNKSWYDKIVKYTETFKNVKIYLHEPEPINDIETCAFISQTFTEYHNYSFEKYVKVIELYPDNYFDLVVIDGRCRPMCLLTSIKKVKKGGWILFDNSERLHYQNAIDSIISITKNTFYGFGPFIKYFWNTTIIKL